MTRRAAAAEQTNAVVVAPRDAITNVENLIDQKRDQLVSLLHDEAAVDRMKTLALHALANPKLLAKLQRADMATVIEAVRESASLGLMPIPALAEGYFVPYWNGDKGKYDIQFQPGYQGLAKLIRNSGKVIDVDAGVAYEGDIFEYEEGSTPFVRHKRALSNRGNRIAAYAVAWLPGGLVKVRVMPIADIEQHRRASKQADGGPWVDWYDAMAAKTALKELGKFLPKSASVERVLIAETEAEERYSPPPARRQDALVSRIHERLGIASEAAGMEAAASEPQPPVERPETADEPELDAEAEAILDEAAEAELDGIEL